MVEGLSSGDFEPAFRRLLGEKAPLSASTIVRLKDTWADEYAAWQCRPITARYAYIYADGIYLGAGLEEEKSCLLVVIGAREDGAKELLAMGLGYRESTESWADVLRDLRERGLAAPLLAVGDGGLGLWAALDLVYPTTRRQRCWNHRALNVVDRLPKRLWPEARRRLREIWSAPTREACEVRRDETAHWLHERGQDQAAETLYRDWDDFTTFYDFPAEHHLHLRTSNAIESVFAGVRLRTNVAKRARVRENALYLVFSARNRRRGHPDTGSATVRRSAEPVRWIRAYRYQAGLYWLSSGVPLGRRPSLAGPASAGIAYVTSAAPSTPWNSRLLGRFGKGQNHPYLPRGRRCVVLRWLHAWDAEPASSPSGIDQLLGGQSDRVSCLPPWQL